jgi:site-specific DNA-methyltransferase (adenine-specific)
MTTGSIQLRQGDSRDVLRTLADNSIDGVACDPPYALVSITSRFGADGAAPAKAGASGVYARASAGFMGQRWDTGDTAFDPEFWREVYRVLKPGAHIVAFGGTRTYHRLVCAIEDAGFEIRDQLAWVYGSGFPKSHDQGLGWGTALKPAFEPIVLARKPLDGTVAQNMAKWGVGALNIDACRIGSGKGGTRSGEASAARRYTDRGGTNFAATPGPRGGDARGRWPANLMHDGSAEVIAAFPRTKSGAGAIKRASAKGYTPNALGRESCPAGTVMHCYGDEGSAARFFYSPKASGSERDGTGHPTVKPVAVMRWLCRLIAPRGAVILDPFAGSGTTGLAARAEGQRAILIEREDRYCADIVRRIGRAA